MRSAGGIALACTLWLTSMAVSGETPQAPRLVRDILPGEDPNAVSNPDPFVVLGDLIVFAADDGEHGRELWRTDGTVAGTVLLRDIYPGALWSYPSDLVRVGEAVFFRAQDAEHGDELWRTDGTEEGTVLVRDINPGTDGSGPSNLRNIDGVLYFAAADVDAGREPWISNGTAAGTHLLADLKPGPLDSSPREFVRSGGAIFFVANDGIHGCELWRTDGTRARTVLVKDTHSSAECRVRLGPSPFEIFVAPSSLTDVNGVLYFQTQTSWAYHTLWKSDGTELGTVPVAAFGGCIGFEVYSCPLYGLTNVNGRLYFSAESGATGYEPWTTDGTPDGTVMLGDINPTQCTRMFEDYVSKCSSYPGRFTAVDGEVFFSATDGTTNGIWRTDATPAGTHQVTDDDVLERVQTEIDLAYGEPRLADGTRILNRGELWRSDGTEEGTTLLKDLNHTPASSFPDTLTAAGGFLFFVASDEDHGRELWKSDGTVQGTRLVKDIYPGAGNSQIQDMTPFQDGVLFIAQDDRRGLELWRSDGTESGTLLVKDIAPGDGAFSTLYGSIQMGSLHDSVLFAARDAEHGKELWRSDGTEAGTQLVKDINPGEVWSSPREFTDVQGTLYFAASDGSENGSRLWRSDGTSRGTIAVASDLIESDPFGFAEANGTLYFFAYRPQVGDWALYASDGSALGTLVVGGGLKEIAPQHLTNVEGRLFFAAYDGVHGYGLWTSDGTTAGTRLVREIGLGGTNGFIDDLVAFDGRLFFTGVDDAAGQELWRSDGTTAGTQVVKDITPGPAGSAVDRIANVGGVLMFVADDGVSGERLWQSDGTSAGTRMVFEPGLVASVPTRRDTQLYFTASDGLVGYELWAADAAPTKVCPGDCDGSGRVTVGELIQAVNIALDETLLPRCPGVDVDGSKRVVINEIVAAVTHALRGCS